MEITVKEQDTVKEIEIAFLMDDFKVAQTFKHHIMVFLKQIDPAFAAAVNRQVLESEGYKTSFLKYLKRNNK